MRTRDRDAAFTEYVAARRSHLRRFAFALCGDWDQAEDLLQIALTKLYVAWPRVERAQAQDAYVRRIVMNTSVDESRRPWRRERPGLEVHDLDAAATRRDHTPDDLTDGLSDDASGDLAAALAGLTPMQRRVIALRHWLDLSVDDVAAELGVAPGTVKSHHARALTHLRTALGVPTAPHGATTHPTPVTDPRSRR